MAVSKKVKKQAEPAKAEPVKVEKPAKAEPVKVEKPAKAEPVKAKPAFTVDEEVLYESKISKVLAVSYKESLGYRVKLLCEGQIISVSEVQVSKK
jgi:hypothetical protein